MPADPRNPRTLILDTDTPHQLDASRVGNVILLHSNGRLLAPAIDNGHTIGMDEEMATQISDALNAILSRVYDRVVTRSLYDIENPNKKQQTAQTSPSTPSLEDL